MKCNEDCEHCPYSDCMKDDLSEKKRIYYQEHKLDRQIYGRKWYIKNRDKVIAKAKERYRQRKAAANG